MFHSLLGALVIKLVLKHSQYKYLFIILFLYGLVIFSMTYFFQSFLQESRKGVIISLICFCVMSFLYLPINSPEINKTIIYLFCIFFPPTNLLLGFNVFYIFEKEFMFFNDNIKMDVSQITVLQMILFFLCSFFIYLLFGYIISQCFCYEYGVKNRCCSKKKTIDNKLTDADLGYFKSDDKYNNRENEKVKNSMRESVFGQKYIDNDDEDINKQHKPDREKLKKSIQVMSADLMNTPSSTSAYKKKKAKLIDSIKN